MSPRAVPRPCSFPRCRALVRGDSRCPEHHRDARRGNRHQRGYGAKHKAWRDAVLARDTVCRRCNREPATVADHIVPKRMGGASLDLTNGQGLCRACHNAKSYEDGSRGQRH